MGGYLRVGLEDAHFGCQSSNADLVGEAVKLLESAGAGLATAETVRRSLRGLDAGSAGPPPP